jgi:hypothetical protein
VVDEDRIEEAAAVEDVVLTEEVEGIAEIEAVVSNYGATGKKK